jgi:hypothetical protein
MSKIDNRITVAVTNRAELVSEGVARIVSVSRDRKLSDRTRSWIRAVFCPSCRRHYSTFIVGIPWAPTCVHVVCASCGGEGVPKSLEAPR